MLNPFDATPEEVVLLTDGEVLDLVYEIINTPDINANQMVDVIKRVLRVDE
jgi:hypothetical protein